MDLMAPVFNRALKAGHVGFVTDKYLYNVSAAVYKVLQTFSQSITWVFRSTMVYATKGAIALARIWGKRSTVIHCFTDCDTTNVPMC